jgi:acyl transferase domain-containing protein/NADPH-dependent curcumin reductase CurA/NAD(P)-dependent dehydrogenase (short-subunit alcohol dehydrogenase family)/surfactin synthase thioesterase subunit/acyl carrier protein
MQLRTKEPIAIVGIGCRFPGGVRSPQDLYDLMINKRSGIVDVPPDRWVAAAFYHPDFRKPGRIHVTRGGFLEDIDQFDPAFFGISPHEAHRMDPHQRLVLETTLEAIEDAGIRLDEIAGKNIAVVIGCTSPEFHAIQTAPSERDFIGGSTNTGSLLSILSNRISYVFDLRGPSFTVDTACSSSLTALHNACREIWQGSADAALAGGANVILRPEISLSFSKGNYLSPDGECRSFSDDANGYVRSEGVGIVYLKRLSDALANGDRIYAIIRGSALNQDGRTPGMTLPSQAAQEQLLRSACEDAGVKPGQISYVEAHGTGTPAGDPVEANAIGAVIGQGRAADDVCLIGSIKTNIGHLECAAGMAGLVKLALTLKTRTVFPNLNYRSPNPVIPFANLRLKVPTVPMPLEGTRVFGGINSFGFGGANAHLVLESPPEDAGKQATVNETHDDHDAHHFLAVSARSTPALKQAAAQMAEFVAGSHSTLQDICANAALRRTAYEFRLGVRGGTREELVSALRRFAETGEPNEACSFGRVPEGQPRPVAFLFSGQGPQWWGMARQLLETNSTFGEIVIRIDRELHRLGWLKDSKTSLFNELTRSPKSSRMAETQVAQPSIFAVQMGLAAILKEQGVLPSAVLGHSIGELAAASCAGILSLEEATRVVYWRSHCQAAAEGKGVMAAVGLPEEELQSLLIPYDSRVEVAAVNGPKGVTLAGLHEDVEALGAVLGSKHVFYRRLNVNVPFHCFLMSPIESAFREGLESISLSPAMLPFYSSVAGSRVSDALLDVDYWWGNIRHKVSFYQALRSLFAEGFRHFIEIGPHPVLSRDVSDSIAKAGLNGNVFSTLVRSKQDRSNLQSSDVLADDRASLIRLWSNLFAAGVECRPDPRPRADVPFVALPAYPFQRQRFWHETHAAEEARKKPSRHLHPHIVSLRPSVQNTAVFTAELSFDQFAESYLAEHVVQGVLVVPAAAQLETVLRAAHLARPLDHHSAETTCVLEDVEFLRAITLTDDEGKLAFTLEVYTDDGHFRLTSQRIGDMFQNWTEHTRGRINWFAKRQVKPQMSLDEVQSRLHREIVLSECLRSFDSIGLHLGPRFQGISRLYTDGREGLARIVPPHSLADDISSFDAHPALLDCLPQAAHLTAVTVADQCDNESSCALFLPHSVRRFELRRSLGPGPFWCHICTEHKTAQVAHVSVRAFDDQGELLTSIDRLSLRRVPGHARFEDGITTVLYDRHWVSAPDSSRDPRSAVVGTWLLYAVDPNGQIVRKVSDRLLRLGATVILCLPDRPECPEDTRTLVVDPLRPETFLAAMNLIRNQPPISGLLNLANCETVKNPLSIDESVLHGPLATLSLINAIDELRLWASESPKVVLVTAGAQCVKADDGPDVNPTAATLTGFGRVLTSERPTLNTQIYDLSRHPKTEEIQSLCNALSSDSSREVAIRDGQQYLTTFKPARVPLQATWARFDLATDRLVAVAQESGGIGSLTWAEHGTHELAPDEVEIAVRATALNFKDVALATGLVSRVSFRDGSTKGDLGMECAGVISRLGTAVTDFRIGDEVMAVAAQAFSNRVKAHAGLVFPKPPQLSFEAAAGLCVVYATAKITLITLAQLKSGETALIHSAAGGVGLAAVHVARSIGAKIIATAGTAEKAEFLKQMEVSHVFSSRTPATFDQILEVTGGRGVDVVLNSLAGPRMLQSLSCLAPFGRFIEIGKVDIAANRQIPLERFRENQTYCAFDIDQWFKSKRSAIQHTLKELSSDAANGRVQPLPTTVFDIAHMKDAFKCMADGNHIGKIVVRMPQRGTLPGIPRPLSRLTADGWYLITGGTSGYGFESARWLAGHGAQRLALMSRSGSAGVAETSQIEQMRREGIEVAIYQCDVSALKEVQRVCRSLRQSAPIHGYIHAAALLDDAPIALLTEERLMPAVLSKALGAWNLYQATEADSLRLCLLFSSISAVVGTPGQANYAAANAYLDAFVHFLRSRGRPAFAINWGVLDEIGILGRASEAQKTKILAQGIGSFTRREVRRLLDQIVGSDTPTIVAAKIDWSTPQAGRMSARFPGMREEQSGSLQEHQASLKELLQAAPAEKQAEFLAETIFKYVDKLTGNKSTQPDLDLRLDRMGIDSLNAVELGVWAEQSLGVTMPVVRIMRGPTSRELARELLMARTASPNDNETTGGSSSRRVHCIRRSDNPRVRLICFPDILSKTTLFVPWGDVVPHDVEVWAVDVFAGLGDDPSAAVSLPEILRSVAVECESLTDCPYAIYGHSMGGWFGIEVARHLTALNARCPSVVGLGALPTSDFLASVTRGAYATPDDVPDDALRRALRALTVPEHSIVNDEVLNVVRRRFWLASRTNFAQFRLHDGLRCIVFAGAEDPVPTVDKRPAAEDGHVGNNEVVTVVGAHMFVTHPQARREIVHMILERLDGN